MAHKQKVTSNNVPSTLHTGKYPKGKIDSVKAEQLGRMKSFKQAKGLETQYLKKQNKIRTERDAEYTGKRNHQTEEN
jgi:hypothetical protein